VHGFGEEAGQPLVEDPRVDVVSFTGSTGVGRMIAKVAGERLDVVSDGGWIDAGTPVRVLHAEGYRHVVQPLALPPAPEAEG